MRTFKLTFIRTHHWPEGFYTPFFITGILTILLIAKWLSGEALQIAVKRREAKSKGEKERYMHLNAEFQRRARRDKESLHQ